MRFANGSVASIVYTADGSKAQSKERVEVFGGGRGAVIDDFRSGELFDGDAGSRRIGGGAQDKGQRAMLAGWIDGIRSGRAQTPAATTLAVSAATISAVESLTIGMPVAVGYTGLESTRSEVGSEAALGCASPAPLHTEA